MTFFRHFSLRSGIPRVLPLLCNSFHRQHERRQPPFPRCFAQRRSAEPYVALASQSGDRRVLLQPRRRALPCPSLFFCCAVLEHPRPAGWLAMGPSAPPRRSKHSARVICAQRTATLSPTSKSEKSWLELYGEGARLTRPGQASDARAQEAVRPALKAAK